MDWILWPEMKIKNVWKKPKPKYKPDDIVLVEYKYRTKDKGGKIISCIAIAKIETTGYYSFCRKNTIAYFSTLSDGARTILYENEIKYKLKVGRIKKQKQI